jgi:hypothetical protein
MVNLTYLVHVGCHLDRHIVRQVGVNGMSGADPVGDNRKAGADGKDGRARTCTGRQLNPFFLKKHPKAAISY